MNESRVDRLEAKLDRVVDAQSTMQSTLAVVQSQIVVVSESMARIMKSLEVINQNQQSCPARIRELARQDSQSDWRHIAVVVGVIVGVLSVSIAALAFFR